jgi:hypothetical protein
VRTRPCRTHPCPAARRRRNLHKATDHRSGNPPRGLYIERAGCRQTLPGHARIRYHGRVVGGVPPCQLCSV